MTFVFACWVLAVLAGLSWARWWTGLFTLSTVIAFIWIHPSALAHWMSWLQLGALGITPWLLAGQRGRHEHYIKQLHHDEATQGAKLSEAARALLSMQSSTQQIETQIAELTDVYHVTKETARALHLNELFAALLDIAPRLLMFQGLRIVDLTGTTPRILRAVRGADGEMILREASKLDELEQAIIKRILEAPETSGTATHALSCPLPKEVSQVAWAPLWREQKPAGVLIAEGVPEMQLRTLTIIANQLSLQLSRIHLYAKVESLAVTDALTGLYVRNYFLQRAQDEIARSKRHGLACTLLMTDLDLFKQKNDTYGHLVGDVVLKDVARLLARNLRDIDLIARFGGEEFILMLIETDLEQAMPIAQRLKELVELHPIRAYDELLTQTISVGVAEFPRHAQTLEQLIERADQALYAAKRSGRNRVLCWSDKVTAA